MLGFKNHLFTYITKAKFKSIHEQPLTREQNKIDLSHQTIPINQGPIAGFVDQVHISCPASIFNAAAAASADIVHYIAR